MKNVAIKNMDEDTWRTIKSEAARKGVSIPDYIKESVDEKVEREKNNS